MPFEQKSDGSVVATLSLPEATLISSLAGQIASMLDDLATPLSSDNADAAALYESVGIGGSRALNDDPAIARLLPNGYANDDDAASEFRSLTERSLASRKVSNARTVVSTLAAGVGDITLSPADVQAWLRTLTDIRLTIAARLGIDSDEFEFPEEGDDESIVLRDVYDWLGWVTESLIGAIDS